MRKRWRWVVLLGVLALAGTFLALTPKPESVASRIPMLKGKRLVSSETHALYTYLTATGAEISTAPIPGYKGYTKDLQRTDVFELAQSPDSVVAQMKKEMRAPPLSAELSPLSGAKGAFTLDRSVFGTDVLIVVTKLGPNHSRVEVVETVDPSSWDNMVDWVNERLGRGTYHFER